MRRIPWFRGAALLALAIAVAGALAAPVASVVSRSYRVWDALPITAVLLRDWPLAGPAQVAGGRDPWGHPWRRRPAVATGVWSVGPNGFDEGGGGDDVVLDPRAGWVEASAWWGTFVSLLVLLAALCLRTLLRPRPRALWDELGLTALACALPAAPLAAGLVALGLPRAVEGTPLLVAPPEVAVAGVTWLLVTLAVVHLRARLGRPGRRRTRVGRLVIAGLVAGVALVGAARLRSGRLAARREEETLAWAFLGNWAAAAEVCKSDRATLEAFVAAAPPLEWWKLDDGALEGLGRLGPDVNDAMVHSLRHGGGAPGRQAAWEHLLRHDPDLATLALMLRERPGDFPGLLEERAPLVAALIGAVRTASALDELAVWRNEQWSLGKARGPLPSWGDDPALADGWVIVAVARPEGEPWTIAAEPIGVAAGAILLPQAELFGTASWSILVAGPLPPAPDGFRRLIVRPAQTPREPVRLDLPALPAHTTLWVDVDAATGRTAVRRIARRD